MLAFTVGAHVFTVVNHELFNSASVNIVATDKTKHLRLHFLSNLFLLGAFHG